jgi:polyisoprenoid-binding protein YceI
MNPVKKLVVAALGLLVASVSLDAGARFTHAGDERVRFYAKGPAGLKINGKGSDIHADEKDGKLTVKVGLTNLKTGIELRDKHLRGYLKTKDHPHATLVVSRASLKLPADNQKVDTTGTGEFTLAGVTKTVTFKYKANRTGSDYHVRGKLELDITDYGIEQPCYLGVCADTKVRVSVRFKVREK